jgi:GNAT superfamily N-acetyltransferase
VAPSHRKQGLATLLLQERVRLAREACCSLVVGATSTTNEAMRKILDQEDGFTLAASPPNLYPWLEEPAGLICLCTRMETTRWPFPAVLSLTCISAGPGGPYALSRQ